MSEYYRKHKFFIHTFIWLLFTRSSVKDASALLRA